jgi:hypothetical protein
MDRSVAHCASLLNKTLFLFDDSIFYSYIIPSVHFGFMNYDISTSIIKS